MTVHTTFRDGTGTIVGIAEAIDVKGIEVTENSEEGSVAMSTITIDDPDCTLDIDGHRAFGMWDDEVTSGEVAFFRGYTADRKYLRGRQPLGRQIQLTVTDLNTVFSRRLMTGSDCNRPAETDVERVTWLMGTVEAALIDDLTYLSSASPVNMDACDYRFQMLQQVMDDCAQASGKNWGLTHNFVDGDGYQLWYGKDSLSTYNSGVLLTNVLEDIDGEVAFAIAEDTTMSVDPSRVYSGVGVGYDGGSVYRERGATAVAFARRDAMMPSLNVKSKSKAIARAERYLDDLDEEDVRIETAILVRADQVNIVRPFHRVLFQATHLPGTEFAPVWCRVLRRTVSYWTPGMYKLGLTLTTDLVGSLSCPTSLSARDVGSVSNGSEPVTAVSIPITCTAEQSMVVAIMQGANHNTPPATDMQAGIGWTDLYRGDCVIGSLTWATVYASRAAGPTAVYGTFDGGYIPEDNASWGGVAIAFATTATEPVQSKGYIPPPASPAQTSLTYAPTPGNLLLMAIGSRFPNLATGDPNIMDEEHWTLVGTARAGPDGVDYVWLYARCIAPGDTVGPYGSDSAAETFISLSEWELI